MCWMSDQREEHSECTTYMSTAANAGSKWKLSRYCCDAVDSSALPPGISALTR